MDDDNLYVVDIDMHKDKSIEGIDKIRQNLFNALPPNVGLVKTAHGGLHIYCNRNLYRLPSNRNVKVATTDTFDIDVFAQMNKYKIENGQETKETVQNRVVAPNTAIRETKNNQRVTIYGVQINDDGAIEQMMDELVEACIDGLKNLDIYSYPQPINMEVSLLSIFCGLYGISNESIRAEELADLDIRKIIAGWRITNEDPDGPERPLPNFATVYTDKGKLYSIGGYIPKLESKFDSFQEDYIRNIPKSQ
ncbi:MAG: hypothetical protein EZS28_016994, partial [Streblomastix strix]